MHTFMVFSWKINGWVQKNHFKMQMHANVKEGVGGSDHLHVDVNNFFLQVFSINRTRISARSFKWDLQRNLLLIYGNLTLVLLAPWAFFLIGKFPVTMDSTSTLWPEVDDICHYNQRLLPYRRWNSFQKF